MDREEPDPEEMVNAASTGETESRAPRDEATGSREIAKAVSKPSRRIALKFHGAETFQLQRFTWIIQTRA